MPQGQCIVELENAGNINLDRKTPKETAVADASSRQCSAICGTRLCDVVMRLSCGRWRLWPVRAAGETTTDWVNTEPS